jgi:hypothetical protein
MSSPINEDLLKSINEFIASQSSAVDKKELLEVIKDVFSRHKKGKKGDTVEKVKRKPSAYNIFMKKTMEELKDNGMNAKEKMKRVAELWKEFKASPPKEQDADDDEEFKEVEEEAAEVDEKPKQSGKAPKKASGSKKSKDASDEDEKVEEVAEEVAKVDEKPKQSGKAPRKFLGPKKDKDGK